MVTILVFVLSLLFCSCVNVWEAMIWKSKPKEKQTVGMRSRRKPVKPGDRGQLSQIHITKRSYKSSRGGVSVDPEKINPGLTIQGHQHGTHGGPAWLTTTRNKDKSTSIIQGQIRDTLHEGTHFVRTGVYSHTYIIAFTHSLNLTHWKQEGCLHWDFRASGFQIYCMYLRCAA